MRRSTVTDRGRYRGLESVRPRQHPGGVVRLGFVGAYGDTPTLDLAGGRRNPVQK